MELICLNGCRTTTPLSVGKRRQQEAIPRSAITTVCNAFAAATEEKERENVKSLLFPVVSFSFFLFSSSNVHVPAAALDDGHLDRSVVVSGGAIPILVRTSASANDGDDVVIATESKRLVIVSSSILSLRSTSIVAVAGKLDPPGFGFSLVLHLDPSPTFNIAKGRHGSSRRVGGDDQERVRYLVRRRQGGPNEGSSRRQPLRRRVRHQAPAYGLRGLLDASHACRLPPAPSPGQLPLPHWPPPASPLDASPSPLAASPPAAATAAAAAARAVGRIPVLVFSLFFAVLVVFGVCVIAASDGEQQQLFGLFDYG
jgi:hypothetical protein